MPRAGWRRVTQVGNPSERQPPLQEELARQTEQLRGLEMARVFTYQTISLDGARGGTGTNSIRREMGHRRPTTSGKAPNKEFLKDGLDRPQRYWLGMVALCKICQYQRSTKLLIHKWPSVHMVHKIVQEHAVHDLCLQVHAVQAFQEAAMYYLTCLLENANLCLIHTKCVTIMSKDIHLVHCIHRKQTK